MVSAIEHTQATELAMDGSLEATAPVTPIGSEWLYEASLRLDAGYYNAETIQAHQAMAASGMTMRRLGEVTERIFIPPRFKRVYVDEAHGVPFLQGTHLVHFRPTDLKYISRAAHKNLSLWLIEAGWVLLTRSGTIGRAAVALRQWDGWAASEHIIRIIPQEQSPCPAGYIYAWLSSPLGQAQFNGTYGAVVDELTPAHVEDILIPVPETDQQRDIVNTISVLATDALATKERALEQDAIAVETVNLLMPFQAEGIHGRYQSKQNGALMDTDQSGRQEDGAAPQPEEFEVLLVSRPDEPGYSVFVPALPGCASEGDDWDEALYMAQGAIELFLEVAGRSKEDAAAEKTRIVSGWTEQGYLVESETVLVNYYAGSD